MALIKTGPYPRRNRIPGPKGSPRWRQAHDARIRIEATILEIPSERPRAPIDPAVVAVLLAKRRLSRWGSG